MRHSLDYSVVKELLEVLGVKSVLTQNDKMKKTSKTNNIHVYNFGIPAYLSQSGIKTCPMAKACVAGCYARSGAYIWTSTKQAYENRLKLTQHDKFVPILIGTIEAKLKSKKQGQVYIRVHDSGDFYSPEYQSQWYAIARHFLGNSRVQFYAYTKMVSQSEALKHDQPENFKLIYSLGGFQDSMVDRSNMRHSRVFSSEVELADNGYINATNDDLLALTPTTKVGLVYHGTKSYNNTTWNRV